MVYISLILTLLAIAAVEEMPGVAIILSVAAVTIGEAVNWEAKPRRGGKKA